MNCWVLSDERYLNDPVLAEEVLTARVVNGDGYTIARFLDSAQHNEDVIDGKLGVLAIPTMIVWGEQDKLIPLSFGQRFAQEILGARLEVIPRSGHVPQVESSERFNELLLSFLEQ